ncbi:hypothetical protein [Sphingomonas montana]|uniref:hypothetical protein n=1 Tax=Sphingomonas montana TaxID=1843236 RepID=UPI00096EB9BC|nr:hypothetical protein [Sphingomonas montana]
MAAFDDTSDEIWSKERSPDQLSNISRRYATGTSEILKGGMPVTDKFLQSATFLSNAGDKALPPALSIAATVPRLPQTEHPIDVGRTVASLMGRSLVNDPIRASPKAKAWNASLFAYQRVLYEYSSLDHIA